MHRELIGRAGGDTSPPAGRFLRSAYLGLFWPRGTRLEAAGEYVHAYLSTDSRSENTPNARPRYRKADPTPLDLVRGIGKCRTIELSYLYAFGR